MKLISLILAGLFACLLSFPALADEQPPNTVTSPSDWGRVVWNTQYAGTPLPSLSQYGTAFSDTFSSSNCNDIVDEFTPPTSTTKWYAEQGGMGGNNIGYFFNSTGSSSAAITNPISCASGHLQMTLSYQQVATFTGSQSGTTLTVAGPSASALGVGVVIGSAGTTETITANGTGSGGAGTYTVSVSQTLASQTMTGSTWVGAQITSHSYSGYGFTQGYGYFEYTASLPAITASNICPWWSFWQNTRMVSSNPIPQTFEFDLDEGCLSTASATAQVSTIHKFPASPGTSSPAYQFTSQSVSAQQVYLNWTFSLADGNVHSYGYKRTHDWNILYVDRLEIGRFPMTADDMAAPMQMIIDLAANLTPVNTGQTYVMTVYSAAAYSCPTSSPYCE